MSDIQFEKMLARIHLEFLDETNDRLSSIEKSLDQIEKHLPESGNLGSDEINEILGNVHTIKGLGGSFGFMSISTISHKLEDYFQNISSVTEQTITDCYKHVDCIRKIIKENREPTEEEFDKILHNLPGAKEKATLPSEQAQRSKVALVVMPRDIQQRLITKELHSCGFETSTTASSIEAIQLASVTKPDMIILSALIDHIEGLELCNVFRSLKKTKEIPIILTTSFSQIDEMKNAVPQKTAIARKGQEFAEDFSECAIQLGIF